MPLSLNSLKQPWAVVTGGIIGLAALIAAINTIATTTKPWVCSASWFSYLCETPGPPETWSDLLGGPGGNPFGPLTCRPGEALIGLYGTMIGQTIGPFVFAVGPVCAPAQFSWRHRLTSLSSDARTKIEAAGTLFGNPFELTCPAGSVVIGVTARSAALGVRDPSGQLSRHDYLVVPLALKCSGILNPADASAIQTVTSAGESPGNASRKPFDCPKGNVAFGIKGKSGDFIDAIALGCRRT